MPLSIRSHVVHNLLIGSTTLLIAVDVRFLNRRLITRATCALIIRGDSLLALSLGVFTCSAPFSLSIIVTLWIPRSF